MIARGKAIHNLMALGDDPRRPSNGQNGYSRRPSAQSTLSSTSTNPNARVMRIPSTASIPVISSAPPERIPSPEPEPLPTPSSIMSLPTPDYSSYLTPVSSYVAHSPAGPKIDYFQSSSNTPFNKKKPPPPPPKRPSSANFHFVTALYDFGGQGAGDLTFSEGDRIRVVKKTESTDDWWEGELGGRKGAFPANYCK